MPIFFLVAGSIAIFSAVFANRLGLDGLPGWGKGRLSLLIIGLVAYGISALGHFAPGFLIHTERGENIRGKGPGNP